MMPRVFLEGELIPGTTVQVTGDEGHHFARVLRVSPGEPCAVASGGRGYLCEVEAVDGKQGLVLLRVNEFLESHESTRKVYLVQALAKGDKIDTIIQKCTEVGVAGIVLFESERSVVKWDVKKTRTKLDRLRRIAFEAAGQSQRDMVPTVDFCEDDTEVRERLRDLGTAHLLMLDEDEHQVSVRAALAKCHDSSSVAVVIGPEGGWSDEERTRWQTEASAVPVTLGPRILRTETAGLVSITAVLYEFGELGG